MALSGVACSSVCILFDCYNYDIRVRRYVREEGEHCMARAFNIVGDFGICTFGGFGNTICGIVYGERACQEICGKGEGNHRVNRRGGYSFTIYGG